MSARQKPLSGWCGGPNHHLCPHLMRSQRTVVTNTASGTRVTELSELICSCRCHKETP